MKRALVVGNRGGGEQLFHDHPEAKRVALHVLAERRLVGVIYVRAQNRNRCAQFMRGVSDETPLPCDATLEFESRFHSRRSRKA